jgi:pimeloyl-ACP methyl ester carboxylesterase
MTRNSAIETTRRAANRMQWAGGAVGAVPWTGGCLADFGQEAVAYWVDLCQREVLFVDALAQRGQRYKEHAAKTAPHVLKFDCTLVMDGRKLPRPVNYALARITSTSTAEIDEAKRPFVIVDPRAGHGPGIGGFKADSEIGVVLKAGHPCYFIGFLPDPMPGQTIADIARAEAAFLEHVIALHPEAEGKPAVIGNCQAGWAIMLLAAMRPELFGPIIIAGSPLSYWAGVRGENPMRYTGGLLGGTWLTALIGDVGNGKFDGAWLVTNFENLNPANTLWTKHYNLFAKIDSETPRYLEFEQWWGGHVMLNAEEMQFIADELFVGNKLATADIACADGSRVDLRNIRSPVVVFCSKADNITPPQQALGWLLDLYESVDDMRAHGQTIVYAVHESIGHLGIFVSGSVAKKEHDEFASNVDLIDVLPPGLYEAVMTPKDPSDPSAHLIGGDYLVRFEARTLEDIRALGGNDEEDDRQFAAVARVSEINLGLYRTFVQPWVRSWANEGLAEALRRLHPLRLQYEMFSPLNPFLRPLLACAEGVREWRQPIAEDNIFRQAERQLSSWIEASLDGYRSVRDHMCEACFHAVYGAPLLQALVGLRGSDHAVRHRPGKDAGQLALVAQRIGELKEGIYRGGPREAAIRALLYIRMPEGVADERGFNLLRQMREEAGSGLTLTAFKAIVREQFFMLLLDDRRAIEAIPDMLAKDRDHAASMLHAVRRLIDMVGLHSQSAKSRLVEIESIFQRAGIGEWRANEDRQGRSSGAANAMRSQPAKSARQL